MNRDTLAFLKSTILRNEIDSQFEKPKPRISNRFLTEIINREARSYFSNDDETGRNEFITQEHARLNLVNNQIYYYDEGTRIEKILHRNDSKYIDYSTQQQDLVRGLDNLKPKNVSTLLDRNLKYAPVMKMLNDQINKNYYNEELIIIDMDNNEMIKVDTNKLLKESGIDRNEFRLKVLSKVPIYNKYIIFYHSNSARVDQYVLQDLRDHTVYLGKGRLYDKKGVIGKIVEFIGSIDNDNIDNVVKNLIKTYDNVMAKDENVYSIVLKDLSDSNSFAKILYENKIDFNEFGVNTLTEFVSKGVMDGSIRLSDVSKFNNTLIDYGKRGSVKEEVVRKPDILDPQDNPELINSIKNIDLDKMIKEHLKHYYITISSAIPKKGKAIIPNYTVVKNETPAGHSILKTIFRNKKKFYSSYSDSIKFFFEGDILGNLTSKVLDSDEFMKKLKESLKSKIIAYNKASVAVGKGKELKPGAGSGSGSESLISLRVARLKAGQLVIQDYLKLIFRHLYEQKVNEIKKFFQKK